MSKETKEEIIEKLNSLWEDFIWWARKDSKKADRALLKIKKYWEKISN